MIKSDSVRARIAPGLKKNVKKILQKMGMTTSQYINLAFKRLEQEHDIPFGLNVPNEETLEAIRESENIENLEIFESVD